MTCLGCKNAIAEDTLLLCALCKDRYHYTCLNIPFEYFKTKLQGKEHKWHCPSCNNITIQRGRKGDSTPVRRHYEQSPPAQDAADISMDVASPQHDVSTADDVVLHNHNSSITMEYTMRNIMQTFSSMLDSKLATVKQDLSMIDAKLSSTKQDIFNEMKKEFGDAIETIKKEFSETTDFLSEQLKSFQLEIRSIDKKVKELETENQRLSTELHVMKKNHKSQPNTSEIQCRLDQLLVDLNDRDQALLLNDVEITGVPEYTGEPTSHVVQAVAQKLGVKMEACDVVGIERVGPRFARAPGTAAAVGPRPRPLVVRLARRSLRDEVLRNAKVRRGIDSGNIGLPEHTPQPIHINERLTKTNRRLFWLARQAGRAVNWKFIWTREGRIYAKRSDSAETKTVNIKTEQDILRVFGVDPTASASK